LILAVVAATVGLAQSVEVPDHGAIDGVRATISKAPLVFDYRRTEVMRYQLTFSTGAEQERFAIVVEPPRFPGEGSPFLGPQDLLLRLSGPATLGQGENVFGSLACSTYDVIHGADLITLAHDVNAPASSTSTVNVSFQVAHRDAPFVGQAVRPLFRITPRLSSRDDGPPTISRTLTLAPASPKLRGRTGVRIVLASSPPTVSRGNGRLPSYPAGQVLRVTGATRPRLRRQIIELRALDSRTRPTPTRIARVRTDARGRFHYRWSPDGRGKHQLFAFYRRQQKGVTSDRACPLALRLRR
jgi:hypothetical protein